MFNKIRYDNILQIIKEHPERHDQRSWHSACGTQHCFAGLAQLEVGKPQAGSAADDAKEYLNLAQWQADYLFAAGRTSEELFAWPDLTPTEQALAAVTADGYAIRYLTEEERTNEIKLAAVTRNGYAIQYLTKEERTDEIKLAAVTTDGYAIQYLTKEERTDEIKLAAVTADGYAIQYLTEEERTDEIKLAAVTRNGDAIQYLTEEERTDEIRLAAGL